MLILEDESPTQLFELGFMSYHQKFQVPKMEVLNLISGCFVGVVFPYISRIHTAYVGEDSSILGT